MASPALQSKDHRHLLDIIDTLRSEGLGKYVDLPEIIVCGDQSAGKSSVLEAISGMSFPAKDNLCTRFPTELVLRRDELVKSEISIIPGGDRSPEEAERLNSFSASMDPTDSQALGDIVEKAKELMQLSDQREFSTDTLRVELSGPQQPHLTLVDLPGLFRAGTKEQSVDNAETVRNMVKGYMKRPRSIILAVVSAKSDAALQEVTELARKLDPEGVRTLGLITKPDCLDAGSDMERSFVSLARNESVVFRLGWHVLKNRSFEMRHASLAERNEAEEEFFARGVWRTVERTCVGVSTLKPRLSNVLKDQIMRHLPALLQEVEAQISDCKQKLDHLGTDRVGIVEQRRYLLQITQDFQRLMRAAVEGTYNDMFFSKDKTEGAYQKRLRAVVQNTLSDFGENMRENGQALVILDAPCWVKLRKPNHKARSEYLNEVKRLMRRSRGCELSGTFNPAIITQLFVEQCQPWRAIAANVTDAIVQSASRTAHAILDHIAVTDVADEVLHIINEGIDDLARQCNDKVAELWSPHESGHPITYNENLQKQVRVARNARQRTIWATKIIEALEFNFHESDDERYYVTRENCNTLLDLLENTEQDMELEAASNAVDYMQAYYTVACNKFVDDIAVLAIEDCLVTKLPDLLSPGFVIGLTDEDVSRIVEESEETRTQRSHYTEKLRIFQSGSRELKLLDKHRIKISKADLPNRRKLHESLQNGGGSEQSVTDTPAPSPPVECSDSGSLPEAPLETTGLGKVNGLKARA